MEKKIGWIKRDMKDFATRQDASVKKMHESLSKLTEKNMQGETCDIDFDKRQYEE